MTSNLSSNGPIGGADAGLSEKERAELENRHLEGFTYHPITAEKKTLIQRHTKTSPEGSLFDLLLLKTTCGIVDNATFRHLGDTVVATLSYGLSNEREVTVHPKELEATLKNVSQLENDRVAQKKTLQECNAKLGNYIEKVVAVYSN